MFLRRVIVYNDCFTSFNLSIRHFQLKTFYRSLFLYFTYYYKHAWGFSKGMDGSPIILDQSEARLSVCDPDVD